MSGKYLNLRGKNFIFTQGVDFIYELFNFESRINSNLLSKSIKIIGKRFEFGDNQISIIAVLNDE